MPPADLALFTVVADLSILTLNLSLMVNTVSFYQVTAGGALGGGGAAPAALTPSPAAGHRHSLARGQWHSLGLAFQSAALGSQQEHSALYIN